MKHPVTNNTAMTIYVGSSAVLAGETRHFELEDIPLHLRPTPTEPEAEVAPPDELSLVLAMNVKEATAKLKTLSTGDLEQLGEREQLAETPRKTLLSAISEELLARATGQDVKDQVSKLTELSDYDLSKFLEVQEARVPPFGGDEESRKLVLAEVESRKAGFYSALIEGLPALDAEQFKVLVEKLQAEGKDVPEEVAAAIEAETARRAGSND